MSELKPCPFCGGSDIWAGPYSGSYYLACQGCGASFGGEEWYATAKECRELWNRRAPGIEQAARRAALEEAAKSVESQPCYDYDRDGGMYLEPDWGQWVLWKDTAEAIRALAAQTGQEETK